MSVALPLQVVKTIWCLFLLSACTSVNALRFPLPDHRVLSMLPQRAAARLLASACPRTSRNLVICVSNEPLSERARWRFRLPCLPFWSSRSKRCVPVPAFFSHRSSAALQFGVNCQKLCHVTRRTSGTVAGASGTIANRCVPGSTSSTVTGSSTFLHSNSSSGTSYAFSFLQNAPASCEGLVAAASASDGRASALGHVSPAAAARSLQTPVPPYFTQKYAFLTGQTHILCPEHRHFASAAMNSKKDQKMETPETPVVLRGEPRCIPLEGCKAAENVEITVELFKSAAAFAGDMVVFGTLSCKTPHPVGSAAGDKKAKKEYACFSPELQELDKQLTHGLLHEAVQHDEFDAKLGTHLGVRVPKGDRATKNLVHAMALGLGGAAELKPAAAAKAGAALAALLQRGSYARVKELAVIWPRIPAVHSAAGAVDVEGAAAADMPAARATAAALPRRLVQSFLESILVDLYPDRRFKGGGADDEKFSQLKKITIFTEDLSEQFLESVDVARIVSKNVYFAQELVNAPANFCNPVSLAHAAVQMAKRVGVTAEVLQKNQLEDLGMFSYLSVNKGSMYPPQFIHLKYTPEGRAPGGKAGPEGKQAAGGGGKDSSLKRVVFVGKGVCFDSGGYNIKSAASSIELMKFDMAGAAAVLAAVLALGELQPPHVEVHAIVAACENMVSDRAYRPGDIVTAADGKTIEVGNTDAEGRLTLADALVYSENYIRPHVLIDVATLTGAVIVALGHRYAGLYSTCDTLAQQLLRSAETTGELMWRMPLVKEYAEALESKIADLRNLGGKNKAGSILAAVFLEQFVQNTPWAHLDIAGTAWDMKHSRATGYGVRTLVEYAMEISREQRAALGK